MRGHRRFLYGYTIQDGKFISVEHEAATVIMLFTLYCEDKSFQEISTTLNATAVVYSADDPTWNKHKVKRLLDNPRYAGLDGYPPLVDIALFNKVQTIIKSKARKRKAPESPKSTLPSVEIIEYDYTPSAEALRMKNLINHGLDHPDNPNEVIDLILQGIAARYNCLAPISSYENTNHSQVG